MPSVLVSTWLIVAPLPARAPVTLLELNTTQLKVVPGALVGASEITTLVLRPEHIV
jgi:hypothetical protein